MSHPAVVACAIRTAKAARQSAAMDVRCAASEREDTAMVTASREAVEQSRQPLDDLNTAHWQFFSARRQTPQPS
jgi:hypothetical protein